MNVEEQREKIIKLLQLCQTYRKLCQQKGLDRDAKYAKRYQQITLVARYAFDAKKQLPVDKKQDIGSELSENIKLASDLYASAPIASTAEDVNMQALDSVETATENIFIEVDFSVKKMIMYDNNDILIYSKEPIATPAKIAVPLKASGAYKLEFIGDKGEKEIQEIKIGRLASMEIDGNAYIDTQLVINLSCSVNLADTIEWSTIKTNFFQELKDWTHDVKLQINSVSTDIAGDDYTGGVEKHIVLDLLEAVVTPVGEIAIKIGHYMVDQMSRNLPDAPTFSDIEMAMGKVEQTFEKGGSQYQENLFEDFRQQFNTSGNIYDLDIKTNLEGINEKLRTYTKDNLPSTDAFAKQLLLKYIDLTENVDVWDEAGNFTAGHIEVAIDADEEGKWVLEYARIDDIPKPIGTKKALARLYGANTPLHELPIRLKYIFYTVSTFVVKSVRTRTKIKLILEKKPNEDPVLVEGEHIDLFWKWWKNCTNKPTIKDLGDDN